MNGILAFLRSTIGLKVVMAVSGFVLFGFLIQHVIGNLLYFRGPGVFNGYSRMLHDSPGLLWGARAVLVGAVGAHIWAAVKLYMLDRSARPMGYEMQRYKTSSYAARTMKYSGPVIAAFVVFHILHLTVGAPVTPAEFIPGAVHTNVTNGFSQGWVSLVYVVSVSLVGLHLVHGGHSMFESLGIRHPGIDRPLRIVLGVIISFIVVGFCVLPVAIFISRVGG